MTMSPFPDTMRPEELSALRDKLSTQLALECPHWDKPRWDRFVFTLTPDEQKLEVQMYGDAATMVQPTFFSVAGIILTDAMTAAGIISGITGAIQAIRGL